MSHHLIYMVWFSFLCCAFALMCCRFCFFCLFFPPSMLKISFFIFHFWFSDLTHFHFLSSSVFPTLFFCFLFFPPFIPPLLCPFFSFPFSCLYPLSMFLLSCLILDIGVVDHVNMFVLTCVHFGLGCAVSTLSHSGLLICDMHFGITHLVPHHCAPAIIVYMWDLQHNSRGGLAFSLAWLSFWTLTLLKTDFVCNRRVSVMDEKRMSLLQNRPDRRIEPKAVEILRLPLIHSAQH